MTQLHDALQVLQERRDWLTARITAKQSIGWDTEWDTRERDALALVLHNHTDEHVSTVIQSTLQRIFPPSFFKPGQPA